MPINLFRESEFYYGDNSGLSLWVLFFGGVIFGGGVVYFGLKHFQTPQVSVGKHRELERRLEDEQRKLLEVERRLNSVQNTQSQKQMELERELEDEQGRRREVEGRLNLIENTHRELERQLENERRNRQGVEVQREREVRSQQAKTPSSVDVPLVSVKGVDYIKLRDLLVEGKWKEADEETYRVMLKVAGRESEGYLEVKDIENFPCEDLATIDQLWVKYSNGKFGFSVQKQIYQSLSPTKKYDREVWEAFGDKVGWRLGGKWLNFRDLTWDISTPYRGHLPSVKSVEGGSVVENKNTSLFVVVVGARRLRDIFSRAETCRV